MYTEMAIVTKSPSSITFSGMSGGGPFVGHSLPGDLRQSETLASFKTQLKTFLFLRATAYTP